MVCGWVALYMCGKLVRPTQHNNLTSRNGGVARKLCLKRGPYEIFMKMETKNRPVLRVNPPTRWFCSFAQQWMRTQNFLVDMGWKGYLGYWYLHRIYEKSVAEVRSGNEQWIGFMCMLHDAVDELHGSRTQNCATVVGWTMIVRRRLEFSD